MLAQPNPHTVVARPLEGNPSSQIQRHLPVSLADRMPYSLPPQPQPQPRPRRPPPPMPVSNDARVLERLEANEHAFPIPVHNEGPPLPAIPEERSTTFVDRLPDPSIPPSFLNQGPVNPPQPPPAEQIPGPQSFNQPIPNLHVPPTSVTLNAQAIQCPTSNEQSVSLLQPPPAPPRRRSGNTQQPQIVSPPPLPEQPLLYHPPHAYSNPLPRPIYYGPSVQPHQLPGFPGLPPPTSSQQRTITGNHAGRASQQRAGRDRRGSHSREASYTPQRRSGERTYSDDRPSEKLWVGNLTEGDTPDVLVPIFAPLGAQTISPLRKSPKVPGLHAYYTFIR